MSAGAADGVGAGVGTGVSGTAIGSAVGTGSAVAAGAAASVKTGTGVSADSTGSPPPLSAERLWSTSRVTSAISAQQTAAMLMIAKTANPELYEDVDVDQALQGLIEEATGSIPDGIYYYNGQR